MRKIYTILLLLPLVLTLPVTHASEASANAGGKNATSSETGTANNGQDKKEPLDFLEQYKEFSGKCMGLRRGDMRMIRNTHPDKAIQFRMVRLLGGQRQASIIRDTIEPGAEGQKLGCELLDDREQTYEIVQARFAD